jgi:hypothetical protein
VVQYNEATTSCSRRWWITEVSKLILNLLTGSHHANFLGKALSTVFPDMEWKVWKFKDIPSGYWNDIKNQRNFFRVSIQLKASLPR